MLNPLAWGDSIILDGPDGAAEWVVKRSSEGWFLQNADTVEPHVTIRGIDGMQDFIGAILEWQKGYC